MNLIKKLNLSDNVKLVGAIKAKDLFKVYKSTDVFVLPLIIESSGDIEGSRVVLLEAIASRNLVIGSSIGRITDVIENDYIGFFGGTENPEDIAERIIRLLISEKLQEKFKENGLKTVKDKFD